MKAPSAPDPAARAPAGLACRVSAETYLRFRQRIWLLGDVGTATGIPSPLIRLVSSGLCCLALTALGQEPEHPLEPPDRSSPRDALKTYLESNDALGEFLVQTYLPSPSREAYQEMEALAATAMAALDLSQMPPATRARGGRTADLLLYDVLNRIELPPSKQIPGDHEMTSATGTNLTRWVIPHTEIALERVSSGPRQGEFLFSADTVARAAEFFERVRDMEPIREVPMEDMKEVVISGSGWLIPCRWIQALPAWMRMPLAGQPGWKWIALALGLGVFVLFLLLVSRISRGGRPDQPFRRALAQLVLPVSLLLATPAAAHLALVQINLLGGLAVVVGVAATIVKYLAGAWVCWRIAPVVSEALIALPSIRREGIDAHLIRIATRLLAIVGGAVLLGAGADRIGIPVYGIVAGLGVGGVAIALAAQSTIENLIGGLNLFADKPVRVGDFCRYGGEIGTVEAVGIRSTRIRGIDRTLTTIPNAAFARMPIVNFTQRDRMLFKAVIALRYETSPEQLRHVLAKLRELLLAHPRVTPEPARVRFIGFGESSLNLEVFAYVRTSDWEEFLAIQEDIHLRIMDVVTTSGTSFAFPSRTLYFARDEGLDPDKSAAALAQVQQWRKDHKLPFPEFDLEFRQTHRDTLDYPPAGSATAKPQSKEPTT